MASNPSRRQQNESEVSEASMTSVTSSLASMMARHLRIAGDLTGITLFDETALKKYGPKQLLSQMLSTKSYISTTSSAAARDQAAYGEPLLQTAREIGKGQCGVVFALIGTPYVLKVPHAGKREELFDDCVNHKKLEEEFNKIEVSKRPDINIPTFGEWIAASNDQFWQSHRQYLPHDIVIDSSLLTTRIFPLPEPVREAIWTQFAPRQLQDSAIKEEKLAEAQNKDCLVRVYLGRRMDRKESSGFKLRNFELSVNEMEYLRLDTKMYAETMGSTLALLHWKVGVDANDVEFILGSSPHVKKTPSSAEYRAAGIKGVDFISQGIDFTRRSVGLWLIDFNQCKYFTHDHKGLKQLVAGFRWNDPYYPRPDSKDVRDQELWGIFKGAYLEMSGYYSESQGWAERFIAEVERELRKVDSLF
ncbi:zinc finger protein-domain-containing protein [Xylariaceae sp. FL1019]|nr:zinc finger protein-domain-containing protein [Xylariaceae sp. FL1019]